MDRIIQLIIDHKNHVEGIKALIDSLIKNGEFNINDIDETGSTVLMYAAYKANYKIANYLIAQGANVNIQNQDGKTALMIAVEMKSVAIVNACILQNANLNLIDKNGKTALMIAVQNNNAEIVEILNDNLASVLIKDNLSQTVLDFITDGADNDIKLIISDRINKINVAIDLIEQVVQSNLELNKKILSVDLLNKLSIIISTVNVDDFIIASFERITNPIDIWNNICSLTDNEYKKLFSTEKQEIDQCKIDECKISSIVEIDVNIIGEINGLSKIEELKEYDA